MFKNHKVMFVFGKIYFSAKNNTFAFCEFLVSRLQFNDCIVQVCGRVDASSARLWLWADVVLSKNCETCYFFTVVSISSVARGGREVLEPSHWLVKYAKSHVFCAFEADFLRKKENSPPPPFKNSPPQTSEFAKLDEKPWSFFFFFLESTWFWAEKSFEFPSFPRNFVSIFGQTVWNCF